MDDLCAELSVLSSEIFLVGDINIRLDRALEPDAIRFNDLLSTFGLKQYVGSSTHSLGGLLDVVISRECVINSSPTVKDVGLSDHSLVKWSVNISHLH